MVYILITIVVMAAIVGIGYWRMSTFSRELLNQGMNAEDAEGAESAEFYFIFVFHAGAGGSQTSLRREGAEVCG